MRKQYKKHFASVASVATSVTTLVVVLGAGVKWH